MGLPKALAVRALQRTDQLLRHMGLAVARMETPTARAAGLTLQWRRDPAHARRGIVVDAMIEGKRIWFFVEDNSDLIQRYHLKGKFYEAEELALLAPYFKGGLFVDIGSNVGNHSLYALNFLGAERVIAFEPNPMAYRVLEVNAQLNGFSDRLTIHRKGLSDAPGRAVVKLPFANIGGGWLESSDSGEIEIAVGDSILADEPVGFIKIDTEGMELGVLRGLTETVTRHRPPIFVEVMDKQIPEFEAWCASMQYRTEQTYKRYPENTNYLVVPADAVPTPAKRRTRKKQGE